MITEDGIEADPDKVVKITNWPKPTNPNEVRQFLGFAGYYRKFVKDFARIAKPLFSLLPDTKKKETKKEHSSKPWMWGPNQDTAFQRLKEILSSPPILAYPDYGKPFELHVDARSHGLGAVLYQEQDGKKRVISYASRSLSRSEANYSAHRLEFISLKWAISEKYHEFTVLTDNNPLTYVLTTAKLDATEHRWLATVAAYDFNIIYRPGSRNTDADSLSRLPALAGHPDNQAITADSVRAVCGVLYAQPFVEALCTSADVVDTVRDDDGQDISRMCDADWRKAQASDNVLKHWMDLVRIKKKPRR